MSKGRKRRTRRLRRTQRQARKHGPRAKRKHKHLRGRSGKILANKIKGMNHEVKS